MTTHVTNNTYAQESISQAHFIQYAFVKALFQEIENQAGPDFMQNLDSDRLLDLSNVVIESADAVTNICNSMLQNEL